jgi:hypothetical protein
VSLANIGTRPHPGGGSVRLRGPKAEEAEARGSLPPPAIFLILSQKDYYLRNQGNDLYYLTGKNPK